MTHSCLSYKWVLLIFFHGILLICMSSCLKSATVSAFANETDRLALLDFKNRITQDPLQIMSSWNDSTHFCHWIGVTCSLSNKRLVGPIPPSVGNLTYLTRLMLQNNNFHGEIPQEVGHLQHLQHLNLTLNSFGGKLPTNMSYCTELKMNLSLGMNNLTGSIPAWIGNFSSLYVISLVQNNFQGSIPSELGHLSSLGFFRLALNNLFGTIPPPIYNISSIYFFSVTQNQLHGRFPTDVGFTLPSLQKFYCGANNFTGPIPESLSNASQLQDLDLAQNGLTGIVPQNLASLQGLVRLNFYQNNLGKGKDGDLNFLSFLANCTSLKALGLSDNHFGGGGNMIYGNIPTGIENLVNLNILGLENNYLGGTLPHVLGKLQKLNLLYSSNNNFFGPIPSTLGNLTALILIYMDENRFEGRIPASLGNCRNLLLLNLSHSNLSGTIPKQVMGLSSLSIFLDLSYKFFIGALPFDVGYLIHLTKLDLSKNRLSGKILSTLDTCTSLGQLYLDGNSFEGSIPQSLKNLRGLEDIDLSLNILSGHIPKFFTSFWHLKVPSEGIFANASAISISRNEKLCGGVQELNLSSYSSKHPKLHGKLLALRIIIPVTKSTNGFSKNNLIGSGSFGSVYKGVLSRNRAIIAVKVFNLLQQGAMKSFINECNALRDIRHCNLLKIISACSSIDHKGNDFKSLIFEFMCNGSLDQWLHPKNDEQHRRNKLSFIQRLNIVIDIAYALEYLHQHCQTPIVHCDLKPSNILLDEDMVAHVGDFGLVKFLFEASNNPSKTQTLSVGLKGSIGYIPPEYGMGSQVSTLGDIFSYGILLLEMFTEKKPIDEMFIDGLSIHKFTKMALPEHVMDIVDPSMFFEEDEDDVDDKINEDDLKMSPISMLVAE
ncbi:hypothetical protein ACB098_09G077600 [Castanea mollissima]